MSNNNNIFFYSDKTGSFNFVNSTENTQMEVLDVTTDAAFSVAIYASLPFGTDPAASGGLWLLGAQSGYFYGVEGKDFVSDYEEIDTFYAPNDGDIKFVAGNPPDYPAVYQTKNLFRVRRYDSIILYNEYGIVFDIPAKATPTYFALPLNSSLIQGRLFSFIGDWAGNTDTGVNPSFELCRLTQNGKIGSFDLIDTITWTGSGTVFNKEYTATGNEVLFLKFSSPSAGIDYQTFDYLKVLMKNETITDFNRLQDNALAFNANAGHGVEFYHSGLIGPNNYLLDVSDPQNPKQLINYSYDSQKIRFKSPTDGIKVLFDDPPEAISIESGFLGTGTYVAGRSLPEFSYTDWVVFSGEKPFNMLKSFAAASGNSGAFIDDEITTPYYNNYPVYLNKADVAGFDFDCKEQYVWSEDQSLGQIIRPSGKYYHNGFYSENKPIYVMWSGKSIQPTGTGGWVPSDRATGSLFWDRYSIFWTKNISSYNDSLCCNFNLPNTSGWILTVSRDASIHPQEWLVSSSGTGCPCISGFQDLIVAGYNLQDTASPDLADATGWINSEWVNTGASAYDTGSYGGLPPINVTGFIESQKSNMIMYNDGYNWNIMSLQGPLRDSLISSNNIDKGNAWDAVWDDQFVIREKSSLSPIFAEDTNLENNIILKMFSTGPENGYYVPRASTFQGSWTKGEPILGDIFPTIDATLDLNNDKKYTWKLSYTGTSGEYILLNEAAKGRVAETGDAIPYSLEEIYVFDKPITTPDVKWLDNKAICGEYKLYDQYTIWINQGTSTIVKYYGNKLDLNELTAHTSLYGSLIGLDGATIGIQPTGSDNRESAPKFKITRLNEAEFSDRQCLVVNLYNSGENYLSLNKKQSLDAYAGNHIDNYKIDFTIRTSTSSYLEIKIDVPFNI